MKLTEYIDCFCFPRMRMKLPGAQEVDECMYLGFKNIKTIVLRHTCIWCTHVTSIPFNSYKTTTMTTNMWQLLPILQIRALRLTDVKRFTQGPITNCREVVTKLMPPASALDSLSDSLSIRIKKESDEIPVLVHNKFYVSISQTGLGMCPWIRGHVSTARLTSFTASVS